MSDVEALRESVRSWLQQNLPVGWPAVEDAVRRDFFSRLGAQGYATPAWPREHSGLGLDAEGAAVVEDEVLRAGAARPSIDFVGVALAGPTLLEWGTPEQQRQLLAPIARAEQFWCQLFSEPGAGSDLAGLSTRATQQPDGSWRVDGQKVWSSLAHEADYGLLLARTGDAGTGHSGLTYFVLDMRTPGVDVRPLRQITGEHEFDEVFFTDVAVDDAMRVGEVGRGWTVAISTLMAERSGLSGRPTVGGGLSDELLTRARATGAWDDVGLRDELLAAWVDERVLEMTNLRAFRARRDGRPGAEGSVTKLAQSELLQRLALLSTHVEPSAVVAWPDDDAAAQDAAYRFLYSRAYTIAGGTSDIQRNIIGERVLGLPREPRPPRS